MRRLTVTALVLLLLAATAGAFGLTERLKLERSPVTAPRFDRLLSPTCGCKRSVARLSLRLRNADRVDASIVDARGNHVRSLAKGVDRRRGRATFAWDGRADDGEPVPDGLYRLRIRLARADRTIVVPTPVRVDGTPPRIRLLAAEPRVISPDGDGRGERVRFTYRTTEGSAAVVLVDGRPTVRGAWREAGRRRIRWYGRIERRPLRAGSYRAWLEAVDPAGNRSERTRSIRVRVRYAELAGTRLRARAGGVLRFRVDADAKTVRWTLARRGRQAAVAEGSVRPGRASVRLSRRDVAPGRYVLTVKVGDHGDRAAVVVRRGR